MNAGTKSMTLLELLTSDLPNGQKAVIMTDNELYGTTVIKQDDALINQRTGSPMAMTSEFMKSKFKLADQAQQVHLNEFLVAYESGKKVKVVLDGRERILQKNTFLPEELRQYLAANAPMKAVVATHDEVMMIQELVHGEFYIL